MVIVALTVWSHSSIEFYKKKKHEISCILSFDAETTEGKTDGSWEKDNNKAIIAMK